MRRYSCFLHAPGSQHSLILAHLAALAVLLTPLPARADTTYVWKDCTSQQPSTCGSGTLANPYSTIGAAITAVGGPGAIIAVRPATTAYKEALVISASGSSGSPFTLLARGTVILDGGETGITGWQLSGDVWSKSGITYNVDQVITNDGVRYPVCGGCTEVNIPLGQSYYDAVNDVVYFRCRSGTCSYSGTAADLCSRKPLEITGSYVVVDGFTVLRSADDGIRVGSAPNPNPPTASTGVVIKNCIVQYSARDGIDVRNNTNGTLSNNVCAYNSRDGIHLTHVNSTPTTTGVSDFLVAGNTCHSNSDYGSTTYPRDNSQGIQVGESVIRDGANTIERNRSYLNGDTGIEVNRSNNNVLRNNQSWFNKNHGYDHIASTGTKHVRDLAYANDYDGFSIEAACDNTSIYNCIMADNGREPTRKDWELEIDSDSFDGFVSNYNAYYRPTRTECHPNESEDIAIINWGGGCTQTSCGDECDDNGNKWFTSLSTFASYTGHDTQSKVGSPTFADGPNGDFTLLSTSSAIDAANAGVSGWPTTDARGFVAHDYSGVSNTGTGSPSYADIGPYEFDPAPGAPTIQANWGNTTLAVQWTARGDDADTDTPSQYNIIVNAGSLASGQPLAPENLECVEVANLIDCSAYTVNVRISDLNQSVDSNIISGSTTCYQYHAACETQFTGGGGEEEAFGSVARGAGADVPLSLAQPSPSPSRGVSTVAWSIPRSHAGSPYDLALYDVSGRRVSTLESGLAAPGKFVQDVSLRGGRGLGLNSGVYFLRLRVGNQVMKRVMVLAQ